MKPGNLSVKWIWIIFILSLGLGLGGAEVFRQIGLHCANDFRPQADNPNTFWQNYFYFLTCWRIVFCVVGLTFFIPALLRRPRELMKVFINKRMLFRLIWIGYLVLMLLVCEIASYYILSYKEKNHYAHELDPYEEVHPQNVHLWRLKPGYHFRADQIAKEKAASGHYLGATLYDSDYRTNPQIADYQLRINSRGIRATELREKLSGDFRIACLGDSCTFGAFYADPYPFFIEQHMNAAALGSHRFQVLNCAVEGYSADKVVLRYRLDFMDLKPDLVIIYIGWNSLGDPNNNPLSKFPLDASAITKSFQECTNPQVNLKKKSKTYIGYLLGSLVKPSQRAQNNLPDPYYRPIEPTQVYNLPSRLNCLYLNMLMDFLVDEAHLSPNQIVVCTLPGLIKSMEAPSQQALELAKFLPSWTEGNTYLYALAYEGYNQHIREMCRQRGLHLIDLEQWSRENLQLDNDFFDLVHFRWYVHPMVGEYIAKNLETFL